MKERALCCYVCLFRWNKSQISQTVLNAKLCNLCQFSFEINKYVIVSHIVLIILDCVLA